MTINNEDLERTFAEEDHGGIAPDLEAARDDARGERDGMGGRDREPGKLIPALTERELRAVVAALNVAKEGYSDREAVDSAEKKLKAGLASFR
jgi:hypothetical protein